jgi:hypothetical protein
MGPNHATILPRDANCKPDGIFGKDRKECDHDRDGTAMIQNSLAFLSHSEF